MSYCANIRSIKRSLDPQSLFAALADKGEQIVVTSSEFPCLKFGTFKYALRGVEVNKEEDGYGVRVCSMGSMADYQLFPKVVCAVQELTSGDAYDEEDDEKPLKDPMKRFGLKWRREQTEGSWRITCYLARDEEEPIIMNGLFAPFVIGKNILKAYTIDMDNPTDGEDYKRLAHTLFTNQWQLKDMVPTDTNLVLNNPNNREQHLRMSLISCKDEKICDFDYIRYADLFGIVNRDTDDFAMARFKYLGQILPADKFKRIDEWQFVRTAELTLKDFNEIMEKTMFYQEDDFFANSSWKGNCFKGETQKISSSGHQLAIPDEFDESHKENEYLILSADFILVFTIHPCLINDTITDRETSIREFHEQAGEKYGLIEIEEGHTKAGKHYSYNLMKGKEENSVFYQLTLLVQSDNDVMAVACMGVESGVTGQRDAMVFELESRKNNVKVTEDGFIGWNRDPYDETIKTGFLMNLSEQSEYDSMFPSHPLSLLRELARFIIEHN
jgi:hypothetical protein